MAVLGGDGKPGGHRSWGHALEKIYLVPCHYLVLFLFDVSYVVSSSTLPYLSAMTLCLTNSPETKSQPTVVWELRNHKTKKTFPSFNRFSQVLSEWGIIHIVFVYHLHNASELSRIKINRLTIFLRSAWKSLSAQDGLRRLEKQASSCWSWGRSYHTQLLNIL